MTDEPREITRRNAIVGTAAAAGLVWSKPIVRSVSRLGAAGTPEPPTSNTELPPVPGHYTFAGPVSSRRSGLPGQGPPCGGRVDAIVAELSTLGRTTGEFVLCLNAFQVDSATVRLTAAAGTLTGTARGFDCVANPRCGLPSLNLDITITGGTGTFAGAVGTARYDDRIEQVLPDLFVFSGELSGSFDVPA